MNSNSVMLIIVLLIFTILFSINYFVGTTKTITYSDGCREVWKDGELQSEFLCNEGRTLQIGGLK